MIEVREAFGEDAEKVCARFKVKRREDERVLKLTDGDKEGVGLTRFEGGAVRIRYFATDGGEADRELLLRSLMFDATRLVGYDVYIEQDGDYSAYGFKREADGWRARAENIVFPHECK